jgi:hypothetical protein
MKLNKAEKFVKRQFEFGKTRNQVHEAIFEKLGTWNFPPEYENALATQDPNYDRDNEPLFGVDYLDDYICDHCGNCNETCFCGEDADEPWESLGHSAEAEAAIGLSQIHKMPEPGTQAWENMVDQMRMEIEYAPVIMAAKKSIESKRQCNDCGDIWYLNEDSTGYCEKCGSANVKSFNFMDEFGKWKEERNV